MNRSLPLRQKGQEARDYAYRARTKGLRVIALDRPLRKPTSDLPFFPHSADQNLTSHGSPNETIQSEIEGGRTPFLYNHGVNFAGFNSLLLDLVVSLVTSIRAQIQAHARFIFRK